MINARKLVCEALLNIDESASYSNIILDEVLKKNELSLKDVAFASMLFYGALERRLTLDTIIEEFAKRPVNKISPLTRQALRIGVFQLVFTDKIPISAAVNESVNIVKHSKKEKHASGFSNGVLRAVSRDIDSIKLKIGSSNDLQFKYSCDRSICNCLVSAYGTDSAISFLEHSLKPSRIFIRVNSCKTTQDQLKVNLENQGIIAVDTDLEDCLLLKNSAGLFSGSSYIKGEFHIQDKASQFCVAALSPQKGDRVLDTCAAPGGKTFTIAQMMDDFGEIIACDLHLHRVELINTGVTRLGLSSIKAMVANAKDISDEMGMFDKILCDVPCSGLGVIGRKPEIKYKSMDEFNQLPEIQYEILLNSAKHLKTGGRLVYSTCTLNPQENGNVIDKFLKENSEFFLTEYSIKNAGNKMKNPCTLFLQTDDCDGFFIAVISKK